MGYKTRRQRRETLADAVAVQQPLPAEPGVRTGTDAMPAELSAADIANQRLAAALEHFLAEPRLVGEIAKASRSNWRAAAFLLERTYPERWAAATRQRRPDEEPYAQPDPFAEFVPDELASRRRKRR
jgi:hypothetical protein